MSSISITQQFTTVGLTVWSVPANVYYVTATVFGASGRDTSYDSVPCFGGKGAIMSATFAVSASDYLYINVGGEGTSAAGGTNGGGSRGTYDYHGYSQTGGGGASDMRRSSNDLANRVIVAGGGGGTFCYTRSNSPAGGNGGYPNGAGGTNGGNGYIPGGGGTATAGGSTMFVVCSHYATSGSAI